MLRAAPCSIQSVSRRFTRAPENFLPWIAAEAKEFTPRCASLRLPSPGRSWRVHGGQRLRSISVDWCQGRLPLPQGWRSPAWLSSPRKYLYRDQQQAGAALSPSFFRCKAPRISTAEVNCSQGPFLNRKGQTSVFLHFTSNHLLSNADYCYLGSEYEMLVKR